jgi:hypothetical protein
VRRLFRTLGALALAPASLALAQDTPPELGAPEPGDVGRPGLWRLGPLYVTPKIRIGTLGLDTNVFYTPTDRQTDFTASGGPGLELVLPMGPARLRVDGSVDYLYFARTESQRRWGGAGLAGLEWERGRVEAGAGVSFTRTFSRPNFEVDQRVLQDQWLYGGDARVRVAGAFSVALRASRLENDVKEDAEFHGADVRTALSRDEDLLQAELIQGLTPKTSLLLGGDYRRERFPLDPTRDADSNRAYAGFELQSLTRLSGRALGGVRFYRPVFQARGPDFHEPYADIDLAYHFGPRTQLAARVLHDLVGSAFEPTSGAPVLKHDVYELSLGKGLPARLDLELFGRFTRLRSFAPITVVGPSGPQTAVRDDKIWEGGADLGIRFRTHYRLGFGATYTDRRSTFDDLGIEGLLLGATLKYLP